MKIRSLVALSCLACAASAQASPHKPARYESHHTLSVANPGPGAVFQTRWNWMVDAAATRDGATDDPARRQGVVNTGVSPAPAGPPPVWPVRGAGAPPVAAQWPPPSPTTTETIHAAVGPTEGEGNAGFQTWMNGDGSASGFHRVWGFADYGTRPNFYAGASASSTSTLMMRWAKLNPNGTVRVAGGWQISNIAGQAEQSRTGQRGMGTDPIDLRILDLDTGQWLFDETLWDVEFDQFGDGEMLFDLGTLSVDGPGTGSVTINAGSERLAMGTGSIVLAWDNGVITQSSDSGFWDGLLPLVGAPASGSLFHIGDENGALSFDVDLGLTNTDGYSFEFGSTAGGEAVAEITPSAGTAVLLCLGGVFVGGRRR